MSSALPKKTTTPHGVGTFPADCKSLARKLEQYGPTEFTANVNDEGELVVDVPESGEHNHWHSIINKECNCYIVSPKGSALMVGDSPNCIEECTVLAIPKGDLTDKFWGNAPAGVKFIPAVGPKGMPMIIAPPVGNITVTDIPPVVIDGKIGTYIPTGCFDLDVEGCPPVLACPSPELVAAGGPITFDPAAGEFVVAINPGKIPDALSNTIDKERFDLCFTDADAPVTLAVIEAAIAAAGTTWDNGDVVGAADGTIAGDQAVIVGYSYRVMQCGDKKPDGTAIEFAGSADLCAVEVLNGAGAPVGQVNGGGGDSEECSYGSPAELDGSFVINALDGNTAGLSMCIFLGRAKDKGGNVVQLAGTK